MNLLITSAPARAMLHFHFVLVTLALLMPTLIYGHGHHATGSGNKHAISLAKLASGAHLVMETHTGDVLVRPAREAVPEEVATSAIPATVGGGGGNKRVKNNNKKSNKSQNQMQHSAGAGGGGVGSRKLGYKKSSVLSTGEEPLQQGHHNGNGKQQRLLKHQQQEHQHRTGKRSGAKSKTSEKAPTCRYAKSAWTECDLKTNMHSRTLSLKKGDSNCLPTRTIQKKCKKACRYEKGLWSECNAGQMTREDKLKTSEDGSQTASCNPQRSMNKKCKTGGGAAGGDKQTAGGAVRTTKERKHKEKGTRRTTPKAQ